MCEHQSRGGVHTFEHLPEGGVNAVRVNGV